MKISANNVTEKGLISKIYKHSTTQYQKKKKKTQLKKWAEDLKTFLQRRCTDGERYMKRCSSLLITSKQIKTTKSTASHQSRGPSFKSLQIRNLGEGVKKRESS